MCLSDQSVGRHSWGLGDLAPQTKLPCIPARPAWLTSAARCGACWGQPGHPHLGCSRHLGVWLALISVGIRCIKQEAFWRIWASNPSLYNRGICLFPCFIPSVLICKTFRVLSCFVRVKCLARQGCSSCECSVNINQT